MKLLFDQNLSRALVHRLKDLFPDSLHVHTISLETSSDDQVWAAAKSNGLCIISKDADFYQRSLLLGHPPKVIWLRIGNCTTDRIEHLIRSHSEAINSFSIDPSQSVIALS